MRKDRLSDNWCRSGSSLHAVRVLLRAGMVDPLRPVLAARSAVSVRRLGPIAGAATVSARRAPADVAVIDDDGSITYGELDELSNAMARALQADGVRPGDSVGVLCRDHRRAVALMVAVGKAGARLVLLNTGFAPPQLADVVAREGCRVIVADPEFAALLDLVAGDVTTILAEDAGSGQSTERLPLPAKQGGLVLLTGGTTGTPKGAPRQVGSPLAAAQFLERIPQRRGDVVMIAAPTFHGTGLSQLIMALALGSTIVVRRRFDALETVRALARHRATVLIMVPTMLQRVLGLGSELEEHDLSSLRILMCAGAALPADLGNRATEAFGPVVHNFYGCTEVALATVAMPVDWAAAPGTAGRPPRGIRVALYDDQDQLIESPGVAGRIFVDNGLRFAGYSGGGSKPMIGEFMGTGDTGHWDAGGRLFVDGRDDDMIVSGGENVFPTEIESTIADLPGVLDVASTPVDDAEFGTRLRVFVVAEPGAGVDEDVVREHVRAHLARFKVPRDVVLVDAIPYTAAGKVDRRALAALSQPGSSV